MLFYTLLHYIQNTTALFEGSQASHVFPSGNSSIKIKMVMILTRNQTIQRKTCPIVTLSSINLACTGLALNPGLQSEYRSSVCASKKKCFHWWLLCGETMAVYWNNHITDRNMCGQKCEVFSVKSGSTYTKH